MQYFINLQYYADFAIYVALSTLMLLLKSKLRPNAKLRIPLSVIIIIAGIFISTLIDEGLQLIPFMNINVASLFSYCLCMGFILLAFYVTIDSKLTSLLLCVVVGYAIKQASENIFFLLQYIPGFPSYYDPDVYTILRINLVKFPIFLLIYLIIYILGIKNFIQLTPPVKIKSFSYISILITVFLCLGLNLIRGYNADESQILNITSIIYGFACCLLAIMIYFGLLESNSYKQEAVLMQKIWEEQEAQLSIFRQSINEIEIKYHDLKRNLQLIKDSNGEYAGDLIKDIEYSLENYDSKIETGNVTFDTLLTRYRMQCLHSDIKLSILADGKLLDFMTSTDIVAMMGNVIENAIEAVSELESEKRAIVLSVSEILGYVSIHEENAYEGTIEHKKDGIVSSKADKKSHGFGTKSIEMIAKKYDGSVSFNTEEGLFSVNILLKKP